ncbi:hypothetical protein BBC27_08775 [Acidithiobacillus ferrivorans]|uniref:Uncharacterized protein n=1 Tax=Acidithiobacillus ferrivorans TaxID=160808 RepID=A0A1B9BZX7_9PROT|nr:hypothetical protein [Acidithiobacillus ferrivorans]OCB03277.1 hypothetical protein BBC27_08775 [Acidithiobacillus ferrivorans]
MKAADHIRIEQEKLEQIRLETERRMRDERKVIRDKVEARKEAHREGRLNEDRAADDWRKNDEPKLNAQKEQVGLFQDQVKREYQQKRDQQQSDRNKEDEQRKADQQKRDDQRKEDHRAEARKNTGEETERRVKEELKNHMEKRQEKIMAGSPTGPAMTPSMINDPVRMAAAMDSAALNDDQKLILASAGYAIGEGWHNREEQKKQELMQGERKKEGDLKGRDGPDSDRYKKDSSEKSTSGDRENEQGDFHRDFHSREKAPEKTAEQKQGEAVQERDEAVSDAKENARKDNTDQQIGETGKDIKERADLESTGKVSVKDAEAMTHGKGSRERADDFFENWYAKNEDQVLADQGVSRDPKDYESEREDER